MAHGQEPGADWAEQGWTRFDCGCMYRQSNPPYGGIINFTYCRPHSSAPALLAALKRIVAYYDGNEISANTVREIYLPQARAAIEAAEPPLLDDAALTRLLHDVRNDL